LTTSGTQTVTVGVNENIINVDFGFDTTCEPQDYSYCIEENEPFEVCVDFCQVSDAWISSVHSTFNCGLVITDFLCFEYTALPGYFGMTNTMEVIGCNEAGQCETVYVQIAYGNCGTVNNPPVANPDVVTTSENTPVIINVFGNDSDPDGDNIYICNQAGDGQPLNGMVTQTATGFTYTPNPGFVGQDDFTYTICDSNGGSSTTFVSITVQPVTTTNNPPIAIPNIVSTNENTPITIDALGNDSDPDGDDIYFCNTDNDLNPANGTAEVIGNNIVYTPNPEFFGAEAFTYTICDGNGGTATTTVAITVIEVPGITNNPPIANPDTGTGTANTPITIDVLGNDSDPDGDAISFCNTANDLSPVNGTVTISGGELIYTPNTDFVGTESFTYTICDENGLSSTTTVTVNIGAIVDPCDATQTICVNTFENNPAYTTICVDFCGGDDYEVTNLSAEFNCGLQPLGDNCFEYLPLPLFVGDNTITVQGCNAAGECEETYIYSTVSENCDGTSPVNAPPTANPDSGTVEMNGPIFIDGLANDTDPENDNIVYCNTASDLSPANGIVSVQNGQLLYIPYVNFVGTDSFTYTICDSQGNSSTTTVTVTVNNTTPVNNNPIAVSDAGTTNVNTAITISVMNNDSDPDGNTLLFCNVAGDLNPSNGIAIVVGNEIYYTPNTDFVGTDSFTYSICDGNGGSATATVVVTVLAPVVTNNNPIANNDSGAGNINNPIIINVIGNDTDPDGDGLLFCNSAGDLNPTNGLITVNGNELIYIPNIDFVGTDSYTYTICDGNGGSSTATVTIVVTGVVPCNPNQSLCAPTYGVSQATTAICVDFCGEGMVITSLTSLFNCGMERTGGACFTFLPVPDFVGDNQITVIACNDSGVCETAIVTVNVSSDCTDNLTTTTATTGQSAELETCDYIFAGCIAPVEPIELCVDFCELNEDAEISAISTSFNCSVTTLSATCFRYTGLPGYEGTESILVAGCDGENNCSTVTVELYVGSCNGLSAKDDEYEGTEGESITFNVLDNDSGDSELTLSDFSNPSNGTIIAVYDGEVMYMPSDSFTGFDYFDYTITDENGNEANARVYINIIESQDISDQDGVDSSQDNRSGSDAERCEISVPDVFTPNGDGINDVLTIRNIDCYENYTVIIFNRYGSVVFESNTGDLTEWDGKMGVNGEPIAPGTYFYTIQAESDLIGVKRKSGHIEVRY